MRLSDLAVLGRFSFDLFFYLHSDLVILPYFETAASETAANVATGSDALHCTISHPLVLDNTSRLSLRKVDGRACANASQLHQRQKKKKKGQRCAHIHM